MFQVTICAAVSSKYIVWQRANIEYLFVKQPKLGSVMAALIARCGPRHDATNIFMLSEIFRDVSTKIQCMTRRVERRSGAVLDIRLPPFISRCRVPVTLLITPDLGRMLVVFIVRVTRSAGELRVGLSGRNTVSYSRGE